MTIGARVSRRDGLLLVAIRLQPLSARVVVVIVMVLFCYRQARRFVARSCLGGGKKTRVVRSCVSRPQSVCNRSYDETLRLFIAAAGR